MDRDERASPWSRMTQSAARVSDAEQCSPTVAVGVPALLGLISKAPLTKRPVGAPGLQREAVLYSNAGRVPSRGATSAENTKETRSVESAVMGSLVLPARGG